MVNNWSFDIQQRLTTDLILDVGYVGQHSTHLRSNIDPINNLNTRAEKNTASTETRILIDQSSARLLCRHTLFHSEDLVHVDVSQVLNNPAWPANLDIWYASV